MCKVSKKTMFWVSSVCVLTLFGCATLTPQIRWDDLVSQRKESGKWEPPQIVVQTPAMAETPGIVAGVSSLPAGVEPALFLRVGDDMRVIGREYKILVRDCVSGEVIWSVHDIYDYESKKQFVRDDGTVNIKAIDAFMKQHLEAGAGGKIKTRWHAKKITNLLKPGHSYIVSWYLFIKGIEELLDSATFTVVPRAE